MINKKLKKKDVTNNYGNTTLTVEKSNAKPPATDPKKGLVERSILFPNFFSFYKSVRLAGGLPSRFWFGGVGEGKGDYPPPMPRTTVKNFVHGGFYVFKWFIFLLVVLCTILLSKYFVFLGLMLVLFFVFSLFIF